MAQVILEKVEKVYDGGVRAVNNANLVIHDKEFMVIVGPSGCGKTTLLRMIAGLEEISGGTITIGSTVVNDVPPKDRDIAMVFQNYALYPHMSAAQNMAFGLKLRKYPKDVIEQRVKEAAAMLGIETLLDRKPKALSGGQRQRVALGRAIVRNPKAFLFDEPLSNLDAKLRVTTRAELKSLHRRLQTTSIYVTHDQVEAMTLGDRICVMYNGVIQQVACPMEVYCNPVNRFVAGFLGTPPMNFFDGKIISDGKNAVFSMEKYNINLPHRNIAALAGCNGKDMVLGIRPEHLSLWPYEGQNDNKIDAVVEVVELLGDRKDIYMKTPAGQKFIANVEPYADIKIEQNTQMYLNTETLHIFSPGATGQNVCLENNR
jgi:multiple sugar transport system ATP-binding protein